MAGILFSNCASSPDQRLLAVGGIHAFERQAPCKLGHVEPAGVLKDLEWAGALALEAQSEGSAEVFCGDEKIRLKIVTPARLEIELVGNGRPAKVAVEERFKMQVRLYDRQGNELEVGKFTTFEWAASDIFQIANDRSAGEFGFSDTAFGMYTFRAVKSGNGSITVRFGGLRGEFNLEAGS